MKNYKSKLPNIKAFAFDVDGVFTDGSMLATEGGDMLRLHNAKDGYALKKALECGYPVAIITGGLSDSIAIRFKRLGMEDLYLFSEEKTKDFLHFCNKHGLKPEDVLYMGDDIPDIPVLKMAGLAACPSDAVMEVKEACDYVSIYPGGRGCVREIIEQTLKVKGEWSICQ